MTEYYIQIGIGTIIVGLAAYLFKYHVVKKPECLENRLSDMKEIYDKIENSISKEIKSLREMIELKIDKEILEMQKEILKQIKKINGSS